LLLIKPAAKAKPKPAPLEVKSYPNGYCCVVGCPSIQSRDMMSFHSFPFKRNPTQAELWKQILDRENDNGSEWQPTDSHKICGKHFLNGRPGWNKFESDYYPSIFSNETCRVNRQFLAMLPGVQKNQLVIAYIGNIIYFLI
jgi:hypothetical protein